MSSFDYAAKEINTASCNFNYIYLYIHVVNRNFVDV
jgi:hypothetical protein